MGGVALWAWPQRSVGVVSTSGRGLALKAIRTAIWGCGGGLGCKVGLWAWSIKIRGRGHAKGAWPNLAEAGMAAVPQQLQHEALAGGQEGSALPQAAQGHHAIHLAGGGHGMRPPPLPPAWGSPIPRGAILCPLWLQTPPHVSHPFP